MQTETNSQPIWAVTPEKRAEAVQRLVAQANPRRIIVFGSQARNDATQDSDLDLLVILDQPGGEWQRTVAMRLALHGLVMAVDIIVASQEKFDYWCDTPGTVYYEAKREGKVLYDRGT